MELFELLPLILIILWTVLGASGAKKKQEEQRRRAEQARRAREAQARARRESGSVEPEHDEEVVPRYEGGRYDLDAEPYVRTEPADGGSAVDMVPDELWAILTGGAPPPTRPRPPVEYREPEPEPVVEGGWVTSPPWDEEAAEHSIEGVSAEVLDHDDTAAEYARARYETPRTFSWDTKAGERAARAVTRPQTDDERHDAFHERVDAIAPWGRRRQEHLRLGLGDMPSVRRAIVLSEVLGPPKSLQ